MSTKQSTYGTWITQQPAQRSGSKVNSLERAESQRLLQRERNRLRRQTCSLNRRVAELTKALDEVAGTLISAQEEERARIARELHDDFGQRAAVVEFQVAGLREVLEPVKPEAERILVLIRQQVRLLSISIRDVCHRLHSSVLADLGLCAAINQMVEDLAENGAAITLHRSSVLDEVPPEMAVALYRIGQEAVHNALKHAPGAPIKVLLQQNSRELRLMVKDEGPGFDIEMVCSRGCGLGLLSMRERARLIGGSLTLRSAPGTGTVLTAHVPFRRCASCL